jgi:hypothetical protein
MQATASTAAAVDRRMARSMPLVRDTDGYSSPRGVAGGGKPAADYLGKLILLAGSAYRTEIGPGGTGAGHGLLLRDRLGGIWEVASGANRPEPVPTELK